MLLSTLIFPVFFLASKRQGQPTVDTDQHNQQSLYAMHDQYKIEGIGSPHTI
jgi:hypothetical protein